jgi:hypothetical protein
VFGIVGLSVMGGQNKPVLSNQLETVPVSTALATNSLSTNQIQSSSKPSILSQLRDFREQRNQQQTANVAHNNLEIPPANSNTQTSRVRTKLVSSRSLSQEMKPATGFTTTETKILPTASFPSKDGIYLYGQSPQPNQLGQGYIVFEKRQGILRGALYMPSSEFSCFQGTLDKSGELAMTVTSSPGEAGSNEVATASKIPTFTDEDSITYAYSIALQDYHQLNNHSASDRQILKMCNQVN